MDEVKGRLNIKVFTILLVVAYIFSIAIRMIWVYQFQDNPQFSWNNEIMINTNDGYWFIEGARDIVNGFHQENDLSPLTQPLSIVTAFLVKVLPFSFEKIALWMPAFFGSLLIVPILLISRLLNEEKMGFVAALIGGIVWSYYNRTMTGYYDTDMLTVVLPSFVLWSVMFNIQKQKNRYLPLIPLFMLLNLWWYSQSYSLTMAMVGMMVIYTLLDRKNIFNYKILLVMLIALMSIPLVVKIILIAIAFALFHFKDEYINLKTILISIAIAIVIVMFTGGFAPILAQLKFYVFKDSVVTDGSALNLHFYSVVQTVREAGQIPFDMFANRISGHTITFILAFVGYILLSLRYKIMWLALPMLGLGFMALKGGLRFTVYAVPIMALGISYFIFFSSRIFETFIYKDKTLAVFKGTYIVIATILVLIPNITHIIGYKVPTVFLHDEVKSLDKLKSIASREDYVISWWDYGYPIRYYSDVKTLVDGGKHMGSANFPVAYSLLNEPQSAANMARLSVELTEQDFNTTCGNPIQCALKYYDEKDPNVLLNQLKISSLTLPEKTRDIYFYLPGRMLNILPTVNLFQNLNLATGEKGAQPFFYVARRWRQTDKTIELGNNITLLKQTGEIVLGQRKYPLKQFVTSGNMKDGTTKNTIQTMRADGVLNLILIQSQNVFLLVDDAMYNSLYVQLGILGIYDSTLFEQVDSTPYAKIYKLKI